MRTRGRAGRSLAEQLLGLETLAGLGLGDDLSGDWAYANARERLDDWISPSTGDIVLLANMRDGYQFGGGYQGNHGSLTSADARVPIAFGYPGWTGPKDTTFQPILDYFSQSGGNLKEAEAIRRFFLRP